MDYLVLRAHCFALGAHGKQLHGSRPYWHHLREVAECFDEDYLQALSWLHDTLEDTATTPQLLAQIFYPTLVQDVIALTNTAPAPDLNRAERKALDRTRLIASSPAVQSVKCADVISNLPSIKRNRPEFYPLYLAEKQALIPFLTGARPRVHKKAMALL